MPPRQETWGFGERVGTVGSVVEVVEKIGKVLSSVAPEPRRAKAPTHAPTESIPVREQLRIVRNIAELGNNVLARQLLIEWYDRQSEAIRRHVQDHLTLAEQNNRN